MQLLQNYTRASSWLDSVYIYCAEEDRVCYAYFNGSTYQLSFGALDDFFDAAFVRDLAAVPRVTQKPVMRQLRYRSTPSDKIVFSHVLPVKNSLNRYNGFFVANISAERLMQLGYGMANGTERQLLIVDADGQTCTSGMTLLEQEQAAAVIEAVLSGAAESGQMVLSETNAICTWSRSADTLSAAFCVFSYADPGLRRDDQWCRSCTQHRPYGSIQPFSTPSQRRQSPCISDGSTAGAPPKLQHTRIRSSPQARS